MANDQFELDLEIWKTIPEWPHYEVSSYGRLRSLPHENVGRDGQTRKFPGKIKKGTPDLDGYLKAHLKDGNRSRFIGIHVLICETFHGLKLSSNYVAAHWNGQKTDNRPTNLRWATVHENNSSDAKRNGEKRGERNSAATLTNEQAREIKALTQVRRMRRGDIPKIAAKFGVSKHVVKSIRLNRSWKWL